MPIKNIQIPRIPPKIQLYELDDQGFLKFGKYGQLLLKSSLSDGFYREFSYQDKQVALPFPVICQDHEYIAIYEDAILGKGGFGKVAIGQNMRTGEWVAVKIASYLPHMLKNIEIESGLSHTAGLTVNTPKGKAISAIEESADSFRHHHYMVMSLAYGKELFAIAIKQQPDLSAFRLKQLILQLLRKLQRLHHLKILHRDIKLENVLVDLLDNDVALIDFGLALQVSGRNLETREVTAVGTPGYVAPEILNAPILFPYNEKTEVYALGVTLAGFLGLGGQTDEDKFKLFSQKQIVRFGDEIYFHKLIADGAAVYRWLQLMMHDDPSERPTVAESISFFNSIKLDPDQCKVKVCLLDVAEYKRLSADGASSSISSINLELRQSDIVWLVDKKLSGTKHDYAKIRRELLDKGFNVGSRLYLGKKAPALVKHLQAHLQEEPGEEIYEVVSATKTNKRVSVAGLFKKKKSKSSAPTFMDCAEWPDQEMTASVTSSTTTTTSTTAPRLS